MTRRRQWTPVLAVVALLFELAQMVVATSASANRPECLGGARIVNTGTLTLSDCAIRRHVYRSELDGPAVKNSGTLTLNNVYISGNRTFGRGGGIFNTGTLHLNGVTMSRNTGSGGGGGLYNSGTATLDRVVVEGNQSAVEGSAPTAAGIYNSGQLSLNTATIRDNSCVCTRGSGLTNVVGGSVTGAGITMSDNGDGIYNTASMQLSRVTVTGRGRAVINDGFVNEVPADSAQLTLTLFDIAGTGGLGVVNQGGGQTTLTNGTITGSSAGNAGFGGGLSQTCLGATTATNVTFSGNHASRGGAVAAASGGKIMLINDTLAGDGAFNAGSELYTDSRQGCANLTQNSAIELTNTIVGPGQPTDSAGNPVENCLLGNPLTDHGHNLDSGTSCGLSDPSDLTDTDPDLGPLQYNAPGPSILQTLAPNAGSPVIDAGDDTACPATDERGRGRPQGAHCDIGAYETEVLARVGITTTPANPVHGDRFRVTATAINSTGQRFRTYTGPATLSDLTGTITPTAASDFVDGTSVTYVRIPTPKTNDRITITTGGTTSRSPLFDVT